MRKLHLLTIASILNFASPSFGFGGGGMAATCGNLQREMKSCMDAETLPSGSATCEVTEKIKANLFEDCRGPIAQLAQYCTYLPEISRGLNCAGFHGSALDCARDRVIKQMNEKLQSSEVCKALRSTAAKPLPAVDGPGSPPRSSSNSAE